MQKKVFIHTNNKQILGAKLAKFAIERRLADKNSVQVEYINVDELEIFQKFAGVKYRRGNEIRTYDPNDLQSFTLSRFMPPELMNYQGLSVVIDPDIFAIADINELFSMPMDGHAILACRKHDAWDTSVMLMDNQKLSHWSMQKLLDGLQDQTLNYTDIMAIKHETSVKELPRIWNSLDRLEVETKMLHTTNRETQPWKTGLPIDFTRNRMPKLFGIIPREPIQKLLGKSVDTYQRHPDPRVEEFFFELARDAYKAGVITDSDVQYEMDHNHVRHDMLEIIKK